MNADARINLDPNARNRRNRDDDDDVGFWFKYIIIFNQLFYESANYLVAIVEWFVYE